MNRSSKLSHYVAALLLLCLTMTACTRVEPASEPMVQESASSTESSTLSPVQGPDVIGDGIEIEEWDYLGPDMDGSRPALEPSDPNIQEFGNNQIPILLFPTEGGFDLEWGTFACSTQPVAVVRDDATIEFWPGEIVGEYCDAMSVAHRLSVEIADNVPSEQWEVILHPPPMPDARNGS